MIDVGNYGSKSDSGIFCNAVFFRKLKQSRLNICKPTLLPEYVNGKCVPYVFVSDNAFPL